MDSADANLPVYDSAALKVPVFHELAELVRYRYLLWNLISRDLKVRYKRSTLGILWAMLNPLLTMLVMVIVFSALFQRVEHRSIYILSGLLMWNLFSRGTNSAMGSILGNSKFITKIHVPPSVFVASPIGGEVIHLLFAIGPLLALALIDGIKPALVWLFLPVPLLITTIFAFGVGLIISSLVTYFLDIRDIYAVFLRAYFYLTPIMYPISILPPWMQVLEGFNPMHMLINSVRVVLLNGMLPQANDLVLATLVSLVALSLGWFVFSQSAGTLAYRL